MKEYEYDPIDSGRRALSIGLVSLPHCSLLMACIGSPYTALLRSTCDDASTEGNSPKNCLEGSCSSLLLLRPCLELVGKLCGCFRIELQLLVHAWGLPVKWTGLKLLVYVWYLPAQRIALYLQSLSYLAFAMGLNCC
jgi:hypothetical protein